MNQEEIDHGRELFRKYDLDQSGTIDDEELELILADMGYDLTPQESLRLQSQVCERPGAIVFTEFLDFLALLKNNAATLEDEHDLKGAFEYLGGADDHSGGLDKDKLSDLLEELHLPIDAAELISNLDSNGNGLLGYNELHKLL